MNGIPSNYPARLRKAGAWIIYLGVFAAFLLVAEGVYGMLFWPDRHARALSANMLPNFTVSMAMVLMAYLIRQRHLSGFALAVLTIIATLNAEYSLLERAFMATVGGEPIARSATAPLYLVIMIILGIRLVPKAKPLHRPALCSAHWRHDQRVRHAVSSGTH